jgi:hypothetical protein
MGMFLTSNDRISLDFGASSLAHENIGFIKECNCIPSLGDDKNFLQLLFHFAHLRAKLPAGHAVQGATEMVGDTL